MASIDLRGMRGLKLHNAGGDYFEMTFNAEAGRLYRIWIRGKAQENQTWNDAVWVQFSGSLNAKRVASFRIGTSSGMQINLEDCAGCGGAAGSV